MVKRSTARSPPWSTPPLHPPPPTVETIQHRVCLWRGRGDTRSLVVSIQLRPISVWSRLENNFYFSVSLWIRRSYISFHQHEHTTSGRHTTTPALVASVPSYNTTNKKRLKTKNRLRDKSENVSVNDVKDDVVTNCWSTFRKNKTRQNKTTWLKWTKETVRRSHGWTAYDGLSGDNHVLSL